MVRLITSSNIASQLADGLTLTEDLLTSALTDPSLCALLLGPLCGPAPWVHVLDLLLAAHRLPPSPLGSIFLSRVKTKIRKGDESCANSPHLLLPLVRARQIRKNPFPCLPFCPFYKRSEICHVLLRRNSLRAGRHKRFSLELPLRSVQQFNYESEPPKTEQESAPCPLDFRLPRQIASTLLKTYLPVLSINRFIILIPKLPD